MSSAAFWSAFGAIATAVSALVTAATMIYIARQTSATRRAAEAAEASVVVAVDSLAAARRSNEQARFLSLEAVRSRIDATIPSVALRGVCPEFG